MKKIGSFKSMVWTRERNGHDPGWPWLMTRGKAMQVTATAAQPGLYCSVTVIAHYSAAIHVHDHQHALS
jgi:hypothetical protein